MARRNDTPLFWDKETGHVFTYCCNSDDDIRTFCWSHRMWWRRWRGHWQCYATIHCGHAIESESGHRCEPSLHSHRNLFRCDDTEHQWLGDLDIQHPIECEHLRFGCCQCLDSWLDEHQCGSERNNGY